MKVASLETDCLKYYKIKRPNVLDMWNVALFCSALIILVLLILYSAKHQLSKSQWNWQLEPFSLPIDYHSLKLLMSAQYHPEAINRINPNSLKGNHFQSFVRSKPSQNIAQARCPRFQLTVWTNAWHFSDADVVVLLLRSAKLQFCGNQGGLSCILLGGCLLMCCQIYRDTQN